METAQFLTDQEINDALERARHDAGVQRSLAEYLHHAEVKIRLDRRGPRPNEYVAQVGWADNRLP